MSGARRCTAAVWITPRTYAVAAICLLITSGAIPSRAFGEEVPNLDAAAKAIRTLEGKREWSAQMEGRAQPDRFGWKLPGGLSREAVLAALSPESDLKEPERVGAVGVFPWRWRADHYLVLVCLPREAPDAGAPPSCSRARAVLGVLRWRAGETPALVAKTLEPFEPLSGSLPGPEEERRIDEEWIRWDTAAYRISATEIAFGLRTGHREAYAGGSAYSETLHLFRIRAQALERVLSQAVYDLSFLAGRWNRNGSRRHHVDESKFVIAVEKQLTDGLFDLTVRQVLGGRQKRRLRWSAQAGAYVDAAAR